jgi:hypothetical protein
MDEWIMDTTPLPTGALMLRSGDILPPVFLRRLGEQVDQTTALAPRREWRARRPVLPGRLDA